MSLTDYQKKRDFKKTPEPGAKAGKKRPPDKALAFVVHKHRASHLHYDLRLELNGVLKSWAIPKGPTLDPEEKRLSMMVEDHPFDYRDFEGVIPNGNYGAGLVMIWDEGTYHALHAESRKDSEALLNAGLEKGHISFILNGKKLRGEFALVRLKGAKDNSWLLIKKHDESAGATQTSDDDRSAASGRTMAEIAMAGLSDPAPDEKERASTASSIRTGAAGKSSVTQKKIPISIASQTHAQGAEEIHLEDAPQTPMPHALRPMLATLVDKPFDRSGWFFEIKWDGYRTIAEVHEGKADLYSRNLLPMNARFSAVVQDLKSLSSDMVLDGEIVILDSEGKSNFQLLQNYLRTGRGNLFYYVFDILYLKGRNLYDFPLRRRKYILRQVLAGSLSAESHLRISDHIEEKGEELFAAAAARGLEGIIAKDSASPYRPGERGREWLKIKTHLRQEAVIGGFTAPRGGRKHIGSLVLGIFEGDDLVYIGHSGGGLTDQELAQVRSRLNPLEVKTSPFKETPKTNAPATWVKPEVVCEVQFSEWTDEGLMRQPVYLGLRDDKGATEVKRERPTAAMEAIPSKRLALARETRKSVEINGIRLSLSNLEKVFWPEEGFTKGDLISYYETVAPVMLPYLKDRPESLHRFPNGIAGESFFQKDFTDKIPSWIETAKIRSESEERDSRYILCQNEATLLYMINLGCIEIHPWNSRIAMPDNPDYMVFDIDPFNADFRQVIEAALMTREVLRFAGADGLCKTSGATGLHVYVPVGARYSTAQVQQFARLVNLLVHERLPATTSLERTPNKRDRKVYLDYLQNRRGQTMAAAYCIRPQKGAPVSAPLRWEELKPGFNPRQFTIRSMKARLDKVGDLWQGVLGPGIDMESCLEKLSTISSQSSA